MGQPPAYERLGTRGRLERRAAVLRRELFLELDHDPSRAELVLGSGRGGTTWLAEALAREHRSRLVFEPFHPIWGPLGEELRLFLDPGAAAPGLERAVDRLLAGRVRSGHVDQVPTARLTHGRVLKDIHATNLLPWLRARHPQLPIVYLLRHPIATSFSRLRSDVFSGLGPYLATPRGRADAEDSPVAAWLPLYDRYREDPEPLVGLVAEWCIENVYPLSRIEADSAKLEFYETLVLDPAAEAARRPSAMDWLGTAEAASLSGDWRAVLGRWQSEVPRPLVERCLAVLAEFGLERLYDADPLPLDGGRASARPG